MNAMPAFTPTTEHIAQAATDPGMYEKLRREIALRGEFGASEKFETAVRQQQAQGRNAGAR